MWGRARQIYAGLRRVPVLGGAVSRGVWGVKGLLGRPVTVVAAVPASPPPARPRRGDGPDHRMRIVLEAVDALHGRIAALERTSPTVSRAGRSPASGPPSSWSVVIPTLDRAAWLDRALWALAYQRHPAFEVIVVRGPCRDETDAVLARHGERIRVLACAQANIAAARNLGLHAARGEALAFLDDDAVPESDWLERLGEALVDPQVAGVGGFIRDATGVDFQCRTVVADRFGGSRDVGDRVPRLDEPGPGTTRYLSLTGANCGFRREALLEIGGFDEAYAYFLDETDVCLRLVEAGWRLATAPRAEVHHALGESARRDAAGTPRSLLDCVRSTAYFAMRHGAPRHGLVEAADRLNAYAAGLSRDTLWREDHGLISSSDAQRMAGEIATGISDGVRQALSARPRLPPPVVGAPAPHRTPSAPPAIRADPRRLHLALLCHDYPGVETPARPPGGIAVWSRVLAEVLARRGHEVSVFATAANGLAPCVAFEAVGDGGLWVHRTPLAAARGRDVSLAPPSVATIGLAQAREALRVQPRRRFDLAVGPAWDLQPAALLDSAPFPVAVSLHTTCAQLAEDRPDWSAAYRRSHVDKVIDAERRLLSSAPHLLANSATALVDLATRFDLLDLSERSYVLPHGLPDLARDVSPAARPGGVEFLFVGRLERRKGVDTLLDAAPQVLAACPDVRLSLVGEETGCFGEVTAAETFRRRHAGAPWLDRIAFLGPLPRAELLGRYAACDVVVAPSRYESFGLVALEAMAFAKPCIVGDAGGLRDVVVEGETGLRTPPGDAASLARAMIALAAAPGRRVAMGSAGRRRYEALFTEARMADAFEAWAWSLVDRADLPLAAE